MYGLEKTILIQYSLPIMGWYYTLKVKYEKCTCFHCGSETVPGYIGIKGKGAINEQKPYIYSDTGKISIEPLKAN